MNLLRYLFTILSLMLTLSVFATQLPDDIEPGDSVNDIQLPLTKATAAELIRTESKGKVLSVDQKNSHDKSIFRIKVLHSDGKIKIYQLDPLTGHPPH